MARQIERGPRHAATRPRGHRSGGAFRGVVAENAPRSPGSFVGAVLARVVAAFERWDAPRPRAPIRPSARHRHPDPKDDQR